MANNFGNRYFGNRYYGDPYYGPESGATELFCTSIPSGEVIGQAELIKHQNVLRVGHRIRVIRPGHHSLVGLEGVVTIVYPYGIVVRLESDPTSIQRVISGGRAVNPNPTPQRILAFDELIRIA